MTQTPVGYSTYELDFERLKKDSNKWVESLRTEAWLSFKNLGFPTARKGNEPWKYTNVKTIAETPVILGSHPVPNVSLNEISEIAPWSNDWTNIVFVNGRFMDDLSNIDGTEAQVSTLNMAFSENSKDIEEALGKTAKWKEDAFIALNTAFIQDGVYIKVPQNIKVEKPINVLFLTMPKDEPEVSYPRILIDCQANSQLTVYESYIGMTDGKYFTNSVSEITLREGSLLEHVRIMYESEESFHIGTSRVSQASSSKFNSKVFERRVGLGRFDLLTNLEGPQSSCDLNGLYFTSGQQHVDNYINIDHKEPHATSRLYYKGILDGKSRAVFGGTVYVQPGAIKTDSRQEDKNLVLSPDAEIDSKPALFIWADDVVCGHGATAGNIDQDTVFYMRSRGLDLETASRLLIFGFASEIIEKIDDGHLRDYIESLFLESLPSYKFEF